MKQAKDLSEKEKLTALVESTRDMASVITGSVEEELTEIISGVGV